MKLEILQENLDSAISVASRFASNRAQLPILGNILVKATKTKLFISSTNLEVSVCIGIGAKVIEEGEITIPAKVISELVSNLSRETISLESEKEQLKIISPKFNSTVLGMVSGDFPKVPGSINSEKAVILPVKELIGGLTQVIFASSLDETRPILTGVLFLFESGSLTLVSTDGFRLSQTKFKLIKSLGNQKLVLPKTVLLELVRLGGTSDEILFSFDEKDKQAVFKIGDIVLSSRLLEGEFPEFEKILPKKSLCRVRIDKEDMLRSIKLGSVFAKENANIVKFKLLKDSVKISAESGQSGNQEMSVSAEIDKDKDLEDPFEIAFNYKFVEDFLHSVNSDFIEMKLSSTTSAVVFEESPSNNYLHLIMPVRTS